MKIRGITEKNHGAIEQIIKRSLEGFEIDIP